MVFEGLAGLWAQICYCQPHLEIDTDAAFQDDEHARLAALAVAEQRFVGLEVDLRTATGSPSQVP